MVEGVDLHELQTSGGEDLFPRHDRGGSSEHASGAGVTVADRVGQEGVVGTQERKIDPPGIDPDAGDDLPVPLPGQTQACDHLLPESDEVPDKLATHHHRSVFEAMNFFEFQQPPIESPRDHPAARCTEIDRECHRPRHIRSSQVCGLHSTAVNLNVNRIALGRG